MSFVDQLSIGDSIVTDIMCQLRMKKEFTKMLDAGVPTNARTKGSPIRELK